MAQRIRRLPVPATPDGSRAHQIAVDNEALAGALMTRDDLEEDLRDKGVKDLSQVQEARFERSGKLSVIKKQR